MAWWVCAGEGRGSVATSEDWNPGPQRQAERGQQANKPAQATILRITCLRHGLPRQQAASALRLLLRLLLRQQGLQLQVLRQLQREQRLRQAGAPHGLRHAQALHAGLRRPASGVGLECIEAAVRRRRARLEGRCGCSLVGLLLALGLLAPAVAAGAAVQALHAWFPAAAAVCPAQHAVLMRRGRCCRRGRHCGRLLLALLLLQVGLHLERQHLGAARGLSASGCSALDAARCGCGCAQVRAAGARHAAAGGGTAWRGGLAGGVLHVLRVLLQQRVQRGRQLQAARVRQLRLGAAARGSGGGGRAC